ncbi:restriction endonuclease subunit S [Sphingomonas sp. RS6]
MTLPMGWVEATVDDLGEYLNGMAFKPTDWAEEGVGIIRIQNLTDLSKPLNKTKRTFDERYRVRKGDLLVSWSATLDAFIWNREDAVLNQHIFKVTPSDCVDRGFLFYQLRELIAEMAASEHLHGSTMKHINRGPFLAHSAALPPLAEQCRIVAKLDALTARLARARAELDRVPVLAKRLRETIVEAAFSPDDSSSWRNFSLGELAVEGPSNGWSPKSDAGAQGALTLKLTATTSGRLRLDEAAVKRIHEVPETGSRYWLRPGDLLVQRANALEHVGVSAIFEGPENTYIYPDLMMRLRFSDPNLTKLLWYRMNSPTIRQYMRDRATGTAGNMPKISGGVVREIPVPLPAKPCWAPTVARLDSAFARADRLEAEAARARALLVRLEAAILARAFRGELVPQDPADEPASVLLDRIRAARAAAPKAKRGRKAKERENA